MKSLAEYNAGGELGLRDRRSTWRRSIWRVWIGALAACGALLAAESPAEEAPFEALSLELLANEIGFDDGEVREILAGGFVTQKMQEHTGRELALLMASLVQVSVPELYADTLGGVVFEVDRTVEAVGQIEDPEHPEASLAALELPAEEIERLRNVEAGSEFNLSRHEIAAIRSVAVAGSDTDVLAAYRAALAARVRAYREGGIPTIAPYARGGGRVASPTADLEAALEKDQGIRNHAPNFYLALTRYPEVQPGGLDQRFFWLVQQIQNRPTVILTHRISGMHHGMAMLSERHFFVGQSYNTLQTLTIAIPVSEGTAIFYVNRTSTDQVDRGFATAAAKRMGRGMLEKQVKARFETSRAHAEAQ